MYKKGINLNLCTEQNFVEIFGISESRAGRILEKKKLKGKFVNSEEVIPFVGEKTYRETCRKYRLYAVSDQIWDSRIVRSVFPLRGRDVNIIPLSKKSFLLKIDRENVLVGLKNKNLFDQIYGAVCRKNYLCSLLSHVVKFCLNAVFVTALTDETHQSLKKLQGRFKIGEVFYPYQLEDLLEITHFPKYRHLSPGEEVSSAEWRIRLMGIEKAEKDSMTLLYRMSYGEVSWGFFLSPTVQMQKMLSAKYSREELKMAFLFTDESSLLVQDFKDAAGHPFILSFTDGESVVTDGNLIYVPLSYR
ncbi:MAG TPA: hypothetical protein VJC03_07720 [bacterium]|nr:hypothetical protein [bacterium]